MLFNSSFNDRGRHSPIWKPQLHYGGESRGQTLAAPLTMPGYGSLDNDRLFVSHTNMPEAGHPGLLEHKDGFENPDSFYLPTPSSLHSSFSHSGYKVAAIPPSIMLSVKRGERD